ncbi:MAG: transcription-repair coupling factor [Lachnospiraceae bacterium]|nr:transcription-repair coupling factor [Lachnospiraceae bacterium]
MEVFYDPLYENKEFCEANKLLKNKKKIYVPNTTDSQKIHLSHAFGASFDVCFIVTYDDIRANEILEESRTYDRDAVYFKGKDICFYQADICGNQIARERLKTFRNFREKEKLTVITTIDALMTPVIPHEVFDNNIIELKVRQICELKALKLKLLSMGYEMCDIVEEPGQMRIQGGIVDLFDLTGDNPVRIEFWGDEIDSIRYFDAQSQRSIEKVREITVYPATETIIDEDLLREGLKKIAKESKEHEKKLKEAFKTEASARVKYEREDFELKVSEFGTRVNMDGYLKYFYPKASGFLNLFENRSVIVCIDEPKKVDKKAGECEEEFKDSFSHRIEMGYALPKQLELLDDYSKVMKQIEKFPVVKLESFDDQSEDGDAYPVNFDTVSVPSYNGSVTELIKDLERFHREGYRVMVLSTSRTRARRIADDITREGIATFYTDNKERVLKPGEIMTFAGTLKKGFVYRKLKFAMLSDSDIFGRDRKVRRGKKYSGKKINDYNELKVGDYVVHEEYGIGIYRGIEKISQDRITKDYMKVEYAKGENLYVPATSFDIIGKYSSSEGAAPKLNRLSGREWTATKERVKESVAETARELVELYAKRQSLKGHVYDKDTVWQKEFEEMFPYEETKDQLDAINSVKDDMEAGKVMDRLICGDVGFGKTEVAIRAAFKTVMGGKQVVYLVPTTILAQQHFNTFKDRMKDYPISIELLCRFRSPSQQRTTVKRLKEGKVDVVIGTHRLLSKDVEINNLGLLIIDEEQRFGVGHKEKIKKLRNDVDVLTLSATPIPRTLHMSLTGIRDMSLLEEAPVDRLPIQTFILEYNEEFVREAINREISRGGQVYYVHNVVRDIHLEAEAVSKLVPEARVRYAHGQMNERELEDIMYEFVQGEIDVLISTTIIETGLDIPNVNTIIIDNADKFGLAQLYQLRGRVGRSNRSAYAFLMYQQNRIISEVAQKRLEAIREFTDLGSGFKISMRDLEIRGAGNLLGFKQSGHMEAVGYELYCKMLNEAIIEAKGEEKTEEFETRIDLNIDAFMPPEYIINENEKLLMYRRIASICGKVDYDEMREELTDRFGQVPREADFLLRVALLKSTAREEYVTAVRGSNGKIRIELYPKAKVDPDKMVEFVNSYKKPIKFINGTTPAFEITYKLCGLPDRDEEELLDSAEDFIRDMRVILS